MSRCNFRLCAAEKAEAKVKVSKPNTAEKRRSRTLLQSLRDSSLSEGAFVCARFFLCAAEKTGRKFKALEPKICTFFLCDSAGVNRCPPPKGARGTERRQVVSVFAQEGCQSFRYSIISVMSQFRVLQRRSKVVVSTFSLFFKRRMVLLSIPPFSRK